MSGSNNHSPQSGNHKEFKFTITDSSEITEVFELKDGQFQLKLDDQESVFYSVEGSEIIRVDDNNLGEEITRYADSDGDGVYHRISEQWKSTTDPSQVGSHFQFQDELHYLPSDLDDDIAVRGGEDSLGGLGADTFVIRDVSHLRIGDFRSDQSDDIIFDTGLGLASKEQLASYVTSAGMEGNDFVVRFGSDVSITLVGVQPDQISWDHVSVLS